MSFSSLFSSSDPDSAPHEHGALYRLSQSSVFQTTSFTQTQNLVDQGVIHFVEGTFEGKTALALLGGGFSNRLGRLGFMSLRSVNSGAFLSSFIRGGSCLAGFAMESAAFAGLSHGFDSPSYGKNWAHAAATLGPLKLFPALFGNQNIVLQHLVTDLGMVAGEHLAYHLNVGEKPEGDLSTQLAHAEAVNWQMKGIMSLAHGLAPSLEPIERGLDLSFHSKEKVFPPFFERGQGQNSFAFASALRNPEGKIEKNSHLSLTTGGSEGRRPMSEKELVSSQAPPSPEAPAGIARVPLVFDPLSTEPQNLELLARLERIASTKVPTIPHLDLDRSRKLAQLIAASDVSKDVKVGARAMLRRSVDDLVRMLASSKARMNPRLRFDDLVQEGNIGVLRAIEKYDGESSEHRAAFGTYACYWILQAMGRYRDNSDSDVRRPVHMLGRIRQIGKMTGLLSFQLKRIPTDEELAGALDLSVEQVQRAREAKRLGITPSLDKPVSDDSESTLHDFRASEEPSPEDVVLEVGEKYRLEEAMTFLTKRQREVLQLHFGWNNDNDQTLEAIGARYGITRERVRQIAQEAKARLKEILTLFNERHSYDALFRQKEDEQFALQAFTEADRPFLSHEFRDIPTARLAGQALSRAELRRLNGLRADFPRYVEIVQDLGMEAVGDPARLHLYDRRRILVDSALEKVEGKSRDLKPFQPADLYEAMGVTDHQGRRILRDDPALRRRVDLWMKNVRRTWWTAKIQTALSSLRISLSVDRFPRFEDFAARTGMDRHTVRDALNRDPELDEWFRKTFEECVFEWRRMKVAAANLPRDRILSVEYVCAAVGISPSALQDWREDAHLFPEGVRIGTHSQPARKEVTPEMIQSVRAERRRRVAEAGARLIGGKVPVTTHTKALYAEIGISETEWYRWRADDPEILQGKIALVQRPQGQERERKAEDLLNGFLEKLRTAEAQKPSNMPELAQMLGMPARTFSLWYSEIPSAKSIVDRIFRFAPKDAASPEGEPLGRRHHRDQFRREDRSQLMRNVIEKLSAGRNLAKNPLRMTEIAMSLGISPTTLLKWIDEGGPSLIPKDAVIYFKQWPGHEDIVVEHLRRRYSLGLEMARQSNAPPADVYALAKNWLGIATKFTVDLHLSKCSELWGPQLLEIPEGKVTEEVN